MLMNVQTTRLPNGARVVTAAMPHVPSVAIGVWVNVGGRHEPAGLSGVSHFIEHLLFKGTRNRSAKAISQAIEGRGGYLNAFTQEENTCYYARVAAEYQWEALDVLLDMVREPLFDRKELDKERDVIVEEIMMYRDQPAQVVEEMLGGSLWPGHSLGRPLTGSPETIRKMRRQTILAFKERHYVPENLVVAFSGQVAHAECVRRVGAHLRRQPRGRRTRGAPVDARVRQRAVDVAARDIEQTHLALGIRLFGREDERRYPLKLLNTALGENMSSRLFQIIREKHGLAYSIHSTVHLFRDTGALVIAAGLDRERTPKAVELILREAARLRAAVVGPRELQRAKDYAVGQLRLGLESTTNQMLWAGEHIVTYGRMIAPEEVIRRLTAVTAAEIRRLAGEIFRRPQVSLALLTPAQSAYPAAAVGRWLKRL
jgi:predicted Zn-dependent peptidase